MSSWIILYGFSYRLDPETPQGSHLVVPGSPSGVLNPTSSPESKRYPVVQFYSISPRRTCKRPLSRISISKISYPVPPQTTLGATLYPISSGGTCQCLILSARQDIHLKPNTSSASGSSNYNCKIPTMDELSALPVQLSMAQAFQMITVSNVISRCIRSFPNYSSVL